MAKEVELSQVRLRRVTRQNCILARCCMWLKGEGCREIRIRNPTQRSLFSHPLVGNSWLLESPILDRARSAHSRKGCFCKGEASSGIEQDAAYFNIAHIPIQKYGQTAYCWSKQTFEEQKEAFAMIGRQMLGIGKAMCNTGYAPGDNLHSELFSGNMQSTKPCLTTERLCSIAQDMR